MGKYPQLKSPLYISTNGKGHYPFYPRPVKNQFENVKRSSSVVIDMPPKKQFFVTYGDIPNWQDRDGHFTTVVHLTMFLNVSGTTYVSESIM